MSLGEATDGHETRRYPEVTEKPKFLRGVD